ncbi:MAG TPA: class I SAM-dependent methyltransferase [Anaeromyxobacteraceae bacterium]|nr:class I SAM-dependent methyltransferase [Anaeromyxobacteraceae bacterium]
MPEHRPPEAAKWLSATASPPRRLGTADDRTTADDALRRIRGGESLVYGGDYRNARQLLAALGRRLAPRPSPGASPAESFRRERHRRREGHLLQNRLLVPVADGWRIPLARAPDVAEALSEALGPCPAGGGLLPLRELLGAVGAHEWRRKGVPVPALGASVHPHHGVFAPVRGEYAELVGSALAERDLAGKLVFDVGTGTGVLAFLAARRGARVVATDAEPRAVACARENAARLGLADRVTVEERDLLPDGRADLVLCNPPWLPADAHTPLERAVYDPGGRFLSRLLAELPAHLAPGGEAWIVISDLAERLGLREPGALERAFAEAGLVRTEARSARAVHPRASDEEDPLHAARSGEVTTLHVLRTT